MKSGSDHIGERSRPVPPWLWPVTLVVISVLVLGTLILMAWMAKRATQEVASVPVRVIQGAADLAERFTQARITETFTASLPQVTREKGGLLELASTRAVETLARSNSLTVAWDMIPLGTTLAEIRVPVTYRYHLRLRDPWRIDVSNHLCVVYAPRIRPTLPPAIDTAGMEKRVERGWLRFNTTDEMAELERSLTATLSLQAGQPDRINLIRENCRRTVGEFVRDWLAGNGQWGTNRFTAVTVLFPDEVAAGTGPEDPVIDLK